MNDAPVATGDSYTANHDTVLSVPAPGLLENDSDIDGDSLTASLVSVPSNGTATVYEDGSFDYTPGAGFIGVDSFTYQAGDGTAVSNPATVEIAVVSSTLYDAYVTTDPLAAFGALSGDGYLGTVEAGDGLVQSIMESPADGVPAASSLLVEYTLQTAANPSEVTLFELYASAVWTGLDADPVDALIVKIWDGSTWADITGDIVENGVFIPSVDPGNYIDEDGRILVQFSDTVAFKKENKDELAIDLLYAHILAGPPDTEPPDVPTGLAASVSDLNIDLSWLPNGESDLQGYRVYRSTVSGAGYQLLTADPIAQTIYTDSVGDAGTYYYVITAVDQSANESAYSDEVSATLVDDPPAAPTGLNATAGDAQVELTWAPSDESDLAGYWIYRSEVGAGTFARISADLLAAAEYMDTTAVNGTDYAYYVTAVDFGGHESDPSGTVFATPADQVPAAPTGLTATPGSNQVSLDWTANGEADIAGYNVYRAETSGGPYSKLNGSLITGVSYTDDTALNGVAYYYVVTAVDAIGQESDNSAEVSATPLDVQSLHIDSIAMSLVTAGKNVKGEATITVVDSGNVPVEGATVNCEWYFDGVLTDAGAFGVTDANGIATVSSPAEKPKGGETYRVVVTGITLEGYVYDPAANVVSEGSISAP
jgi:fibronectin type 3 domain-containing protein